ncbi:MAG TPA: ATP-binding cassette domain-containing protein [Mycobacteriales bacterium]|jgi:ABC-2 type transport system ATP-binding protein|nr:ATP-binding cassette domain-containing protein [Mycobacteriales bacterium]
MAVDAEELRVRIGRREIVRGVDLSLETGVTGLLGPNGAGKTTLIRALATALPAAAGTLRLFGTALPCRDRRLREIRSRLGYAPQLPLVLRHLTVLDQVAYAAWLKGFTPRAGEVRARRALAQVDLADRAGDRTKTLSGGMLRRLGTAMALVGDPDLLLLDEPTTGLDPEQRVAFRRLVHRLGETRTVLLSTHLIEDVVSLCARIVVLADGQIVFDGTVDGLAGQASAAHADGRSPVEAGFRTVTGGGP